MTGRGSRAVFVVISRVTSRRYYFVANDTLRLGVVPPAAGQSTISFTNEQY